MTTVTTSHRATTTPPTAEVAGDAGHSAEQIATQRPADLIAFPRLRGGWRLDADRGLRLVWRFEPAA